MKRIQLKKQLQSHLKDLEEKSNNKNNITTFGIPEPKVEGTQSEENGWYKNGVGLCKNTYEVDITTCTGGNIDKANMGEMGEIS